MTQALLSITGQGLITGEPVSVEIERLPEGSGIVFEVDQVVIPAQPEYVINADRGVTLGKDGKHLSIVEHFLSACAMTRTTDLKVRVSGAPELPILDGSAQEWVHFLNQSLGNSPSTLASDSLTLKQPVYYQDPKRPWIQLVALPASTLQITYLVDFPHPDLNRRWFTWREEDGDLTETIAPARTFGRLSDLPMLQAQGLARGVTLENTLGLTDDGGYTSPLRMPDEPIRHKILDFIGDLMLCGIPITQVKAHFTVTSGGHASHLAFGQHLQKHLSTEALL